MPEISAFGQYLMLKNFNLRTPNGTDTWKAVIIPFKQRLCYLNLTFNSSSKTYALNASSLIVPPSPSQVPFPCAVFKNAILLAYQSPYGSIEWQNSFYFCTERPNRLRNTAFLGVTFDFINCVNLQSLCRESDSQILSHN